MTRIVTTHYRYKRPPRKRAKTAAIEGPTVITAKTPKRSNAPVRRLSKTAAPADTAPPANDDRKSAIVTARRPGKRYADVPEVTEEEHRAIGDRADALFQEMKRQIAEKLRK